MQNILRSVQNSTQQIVPILRTETQRELLVELFFRTERPRTLSDLARAIGVDQTTVMREVNRLLVSGVVVEERVGRARTVEINESSPFAGPLRQLMRVVYQPIGDLSDGLHIVPGGRHGASRAGNGRHERRPLPSSRRRP